MKSLVRKFLVLSLCAVVSSAFWGCGVSDKKLGEAQKKISALQIKGIPDSLLSEASVLLVQSKTSKKLGNSRLAKANYDSLIVLLSQAEASFGETTARLKPVVDSLRKAIDEKIKTLNGYHLKEADSLIAILDATVKRNDWPMAHAQEVMILDTSILALEASQKMAEETKAKLIGSWIANQNMKDPEMEVNAVRKESYAFLKDGKVNISEELKGQTGQSQKEDWKFESSGTYECKGSDVIIDVTHEKCLKQVYESLKEKDGKKTWIKLEKPTYDSTIVSGKKLRVVPFDEIKQTYKKK